MKPTPAVILFSFLPTVVLSAVGILALVFQRGGIDITFGVLVLTFSSAVLAGGILAILFFRRDARRRQLQTDFVSKVSHELRTPMASIRMFAETLERSDLEDQERQAVLDAMSVEASRLSFLIERLLSWGRMESGRQTYRLRPERADTLVAEALAQVEAQVLQSGVAVELVLPDEVPAVEADRNALVETLANLMRNAIKYGADGGVLRVVVRSEGGRVCIDVVDRGPGIPRKEQRRVFEKFYRGSAAEVRNIAGTGLGLAMAVHVLRAHSGRVRLESHLGEGATFTVQLPAIEAAAALEVPPDVH